MRIFVLGLPLLLGPAYPSGAAEQLCGGYSEASVTNAEVVAAAQFAVKTQSALPEQKAAITVVEIRSAQRQIVAGMNYRMRLKVKVAGLEKEGDAVVWRKLSGEQALTSWEWKAFGDRTGAFVLIDCSSGTVSDSDQTASSERLPPCSTFKIWNTLIGLEAGVISSPDEPFYKWDGEVRAIREWNKDLTVKEAFQASCVPAFQSLARKIGHDRMQAWIEKIGYGDRDISAGQDIFWLPAKGRKTVLITPTEQAQLMCRLASGKLPFSEKSMAVLKEIMAVKTTDRGVLYGKTGSGMGEDGQYRLGWFVGFVESKGKTYGFACDAQGDGVMGKDARAITEAVLKAQDIL